jgi:AraC-like DNA-binding protein
MSKLSPASKDPTISYQIVAALVEAIGGYPDDIAEGLRKFDFDALESPTARVPLRSFVELFEWLARKMERPYLGLELSERGGPQTVGAVGYLFLESRNLEAALNNLGKYLFAVQEGSSFKLEIDGEYAFVDYGILDDRITNRRQDSEYSIGSTWNLIKQFTGSACQLTMVEFEHEKPSPSDAAFRHVFGAPVLFRRRANRLHFRSNLLQAASRSGDPFLFPILETYIQSSIAEIDKADSFVDLVRAQLSHETLSAGLRARDVAARMGISESTLHRRLGIEQSSFKMIYDESAKSFASLLIRQKSLPVATLASRLGYSETAALTRAFHRWFGMSPSQYRKQLD